MQIDKEVLALMSEEFSDFDLQSEAKASWQFADFWQKVSDILKCSYHTFDCNKYGQVLARLGKVRIEIDPETKGTLSKPWFKYSTNTNTSIAGPFRDNFPENPEEAAKMIVKDLGMDARGLDMDPNESKNEATLADVEVGDVVRFDGKDGYEYPGKVVRIDKDFVFPIRVEVTGFQKSITPEEVIEVTKPGLITEQKNEATNDSEIDALIKRMTNYLADELYSYYEYSERRDFCQKYAEIIMNKPMNLKQAIIDFNNGNYD